MAFKFEDFHGRHPFPPSEKKPTIITRDKMVTFAYGNKPHLDFNWLFVSTDRLQVGIYQIPLGGTLTVPLPEAAQNFKVREGEAFFVPERVKHEYHNFTDKVVKAVFIVAPQL